MNLSAGLPCQSPAQATSDIMWPQMATLHAPPCSPQTNKLLIFKQGDMSPKTEFMRVHVANSLHLMRKLSNSRPLNYLCKFEQDGPSC